MIFENLSWIAQKVLTETILEVILLSSTTSSYMNTYYFSYKMIVHVALSCMRAFSMLRCVHRFPTRDMQAIVSLVFFWGMIVRDYLPTDESIPNCKVFMLVPYAFHRVFQEYDD
jgi:hypothetical protein